MLTLSMRRYILKWIASTGNILPPDSRALGRVNKTTTPIVVPCIIPSITFDQKLILVFLSLMQKSLHYKTYLCFLYSNLITNNVSRAPYTTT